MYFVMFSIEILKILNVFWLVEVGVPMVTFDGGGDRDWGWWTLFLIGFAIIVLSSSGCLTNIIDFAHFDF